MDRFRPVLFLIQSQIKTQMNAIVKTFAASPEQYHAARSFNLQNQIFLSGSLICFQYFDSVDSAREYLNQIARKLYFEDIQEMIQNVWSFGLTFKNASAIILTGEQLQSFKTIIEHQSQIKSKNHVQTTN